MQGRRANSLPRLAVAATVLLLALSACSSASDGERAGSTQPAPIEPSLLPPTPPPAPVATVAVTGTGSLPSTFVCNGLALPLGAFGSLEQLSDRPLPDGAFDPLEEFLATGEGDFWVQDGYWVVEVSADHYLLVHHDGATGSMTILGTERQDDGAWRATTIETGQACELRMQLPDGFGIVDWRISPREDMPTDERYFDVAAKGQACSGGQPMGDRLASPQVVETNTSVFITLMAELPQGVQTCPGNPEESVRIELDAPLGDREIRDGLRSGQTLADLVPPSP